MIRRCSPDDLEAVQTIVNAAAQAKKGVIAEDRWKEPYMTEEELLEETESAVTFWGYEDGDELVGVMGIQPVRDFTLIRHAYVRHDMQKRNRRIVTEGPLPADRWPATGWHLGGCLLGDSLL